MKIRFLGSNFKDLRFGVKMQGNLVYKELINQRIKIVNDYKKADILHSNDLSPKNLYIASKAKKKGIKTIVTGHASSTPNSDVWIIPKGIWDFYFRKAYNLFDKVISISRDNQNYLIELGVPKNKLVHNYIGIDLNHFKYSKKFRKKFRKKLGVSSSDKLIISVGHICPLKGVFEFIELKKLLPDYKFVWIGDYLIFKGFEWLTRDYTKIKKIIKSNKEVFIGTLNYDEMISAYSGADLLLSLSNYETFGMTLLEALATKLKVIAKPLSVFKELWGENIMYGSSINDFAKKIKKVQKKRYNKGRKLAKKYDSKNHVKRLIKIYEDLLNE